MAAGKWKLYDLAKLHLSDGTLDLDSNTFKMGLFSSSSNANTLGSGNGKLGDLTNELSTANGYTAGGKTLTPTWTNSSGTETFDCDDQVWTATGGSITARFAVIYASGTLNGIVNPLLAVCLLDTTPADVTATSGNTFTMTINASGVFTSSGATSD
jgi:hypothetical protein